MSLEEWKQIIAFLNECSQKVPCILVDDIAYIDYSYNLAQSRRYMVSPSVIMQRFYYTE